MWFGLLGAVSRGFPKEDTSELNLKGIGKGVSKVEGQESCFKGRDSVILNRSLRQKYRVAILSLKKFPTSEVQCRLSGSPQSAFAPALEAMAAFVSHEVLGLHLGTLWNEHLSLGVRIVLRVVRCSSWVEPTRTGTTGGNSRATCLPLLTHMRRLECWARSQDQFRIAASLPSLSRLSYVVGCV